MIPKIIHQLWFGHKEMPSESALSLKAINPDFKYYIWTEENLPVLHNQKAFRATTSYAMKSDIARLEILYIYGGIYVDTDFIALRPFTSLLSESLFLCEEPGTGFPGNFIIGAEKQNAEIKRLYSLIDYKVVISETKNKNVVKAAGPIFYHKNLNKEKARIFPSYLFSPLSMGEARRNDIPEITIKNFPNSYGVHLWSHMKNHWNA